MILSTETGVWEERLRALRGREELRPWVEAVRAHPPETAPDLDTVYRMMASDHRLVYPC